LTGIPLNLGNLPLLLLPANMMLWIPGVVFGLTLVICVRRFRSSTIMPMLLIAGIILFYLVLVFTDTSIAEARALGLLLGEGGIFAWQPLNLDMLRSADWSAILNQWPNFLVLMGITLAGLLLNLSAIEVEIRREYGINRELLITGIALSVVGFLGGIIGYHDLGATRLARDIGALKRLTAILGILICLLIIIFGTALLAFIPMPVVGGLLFFLGLDFLLEWVIMGWKRFSRVEYGIVLLILAVIVTTNFMLGIAVGLVAMLLIFVVSYSRIKVIKHEFSGADIQSNVGRSIGQRSFLAQEGDQVYVLELQGFLFFGTANALVEQIKKRLNDPGLKPLRYTILDFRLVTGIDSSAALAFCKCEQMARENNFSLIFTNITPEIRRQLQSSGLSMDDELVRALNDLDHGLEWCEEQILPVPGLGESRLPSLRAQLELEGLEPELSERLESYLKPVLVQPGDYLIHQDEISEDMYYIVDGQVSVYIESEKGERVRLRSLGRGTIVGELGLYLHIPRTASVIADLPTTAYQLTRQALDEIQHHDPELTAAFHQMIARQVSERLVQTNRGISALLGK
jgi:SulP family sulfate permease